MKKLLILSGLLVTCSIGAYSQSEVAEPDDKELTVPFVIISEKVDKGELYVNPDNIEVDLDQENGVETALRKEDGVIQISEVEYEKLNADKQDRIKDQGNLILTEPSPVDLSTIEIESENEEE